MANAFAQNVSDVSGGFGGAPGTSSGVSQGSTFFSDPAFVQKLLESLGGQQQQFNEYLSNPTASPLYTNQLRGLLASLAPQEQASRQALTDAGTAAGNRSSGAYAKAGANLEGNIMRNQQSTAGQLLGQNFGQMTQALLQAMGLTPQMLNALKLSQQSGARSSVGGAGGGSITGSGASLPPSGAGQVGGFDLSSILDGGGGGGFSPLNPGRNEYEQSYFSRYGILPGQGENLAPIGGTYFQPNGNYITGGTGQPGAWTPPEQSQDEWGFTPQDWAADEYYNQ